MRKLAVSILMMVYFLFTTGVMVSHHYCMNKLASAEILVTASKECGKCGMHIADENGCCRDELIIVKSDNTDAQINPVVTDLFHSAGMMAVLPSQFITTSTYNAPGAIASVMHSPPLLDHEPIHVVNCVFRI